jgi:hypothetical protein
LYRRLHVIIGDANMSEVATALKVGTMGLVIDLMERGVCPADIQLADAVAAVKAISCDPSLKTVVPRLNGRTISAVDIQRHYLAAAQRHFKGRDTETDWVLKRWEQTLNQLERDPMECVGCLDWVAKKFLLETFRDAERLSWDNPWLKSLDLEYHDPAREDGLYYALVEQGNIERFVSEADIHKALSQPPADTRAYFRGRCVDRFAKQMTSVQWDEIVFGDDNGQNFAISLNNLFDEKEIRRYNEAVDNAKDTGTLLQSLKG